MLDYKVIVIRVILMPINNKITDSYCVN